jgi:hypothetical protein
MAACLAIADLDFVFRVRPQLAAPDRLRWLVSVAVPPETTFTNVGTEFRSTNAFELTPRFLLAPATSAFSGSCLRSALRREWRKSSAVLNCVVGLGERLFVRLNVDATNRVPALSLKTNVGNRG